MEKDFGYGDFAIVRNLTPEDFTNGNIELRKGEQITPSKLIEQLSGKIVRVFDRVIPYKFGGNDMFHITREGRIKISAKLLDSISTLDAYKQLSSKEVKIGDILEGNDLANIFYNVTCNRMKKAVVWDIEEGYMKLVMLEHEKYKTLYAAQMIVGNSHGEIGAVYNAFNVIGHTEVLKLKVHCDYKKPRYDNKKYACFGSLGMFIDNFSDTLMNLASNLGYCPITKLIETEDVKEFEDTINSNTCLRIKIVR